MSHTPFAQVKKRESIASGGFWPVPVPVIGTVCGLAGALSVRMNVAERGPVAFGEKLIETLQVGPAGNVSPEHPSSTCVKSSGLAPRVAALLMNSEPLPVFLIVIECGALVVWIACAPKVNEVGVNATDGVPVGGGGGGVPPLRPPPPPPRPWLPSATVGSARAAKAVSRTNPLRSRRIMRIPPTELTEGLRRPSKIGFFAQTTGTWRPPSAAEGNLCSRAAARTTDWD